MKRNILHHILHLAVDSLLASSREFQENDFGWAKQNFNYFEITIIKLENIPLSGNIQAQKNIRARNALINVLTYFVCYYTRYS